ncbi:MAG: beta-lactamase family protein [Pseudomonadales bacterium]|nr:beta-lactamase family protein [Pseudomonadales bacterium]MCP5184779.1 beta-lactamase family protein [Pseudomonadales bacterium]
MNRAERMAEVARRYVDRKQYASIEWLVEHQGKVLTQGQAGHFDADAGTPLPAEPIYRIYSMTKPIVSVLALILMEQGKLRLYDMLVQFNRAFAAMRVLHADGRLEPANRFITVDDLITHRAGFTYPFIHGCQVAPYYREARILEDGHIPLEEMMDRLARMPLAFQPGTKFRYSVCTDALAHVVEKAADMPIDEFARRELFEPLGMADTSYRVPKDKQDRVLPMYGAGDLLAVPPLDLTPHKLERRDDVEDFYPLDLAGHRRGGHGLYSTTADYARFARMLLSGKSADGRTILSRPMLNMMRANRLTPQQLPLTVGMQVLAGYGWGLGVRVMLDTGQAPQLTNVGELGWAGAASTFFWVDPAEEMIGLVMAQYLGSALPLADDMRTAAYQMLD